jgi:hypothetical protein
MPNGLELTFLVPADARFRSSHQARSVFAAFGQDLDVRLFHDSRHAPTGQMSPYRIDAYGNEIRIVACGHAAVACLRQNAMRMLDALTRWLSAKHTGGMPDMRMRPVEFGFARLPYMLTYLIRRMVITTDHLPDSHPWRMASVAGEDPMDNPDLVAEIERMIQRDLVRQANLLEINDDPADVPVYVASMDALTPIRAEFSGCPNRIMLHTTLRVGIQAMLIGPWAFGPMVSRGFGEARLLKTGRAPRRRKDTEDLAVYR